jgi:catecholate siderophore receptor
MGLDSRSLTTTTALGAVLSLAIAGPAVAQTATQTAKDKATLSTVSVEAAADTGYKVDRSAQKKFTAPLVDTPKTVTVIPKELIDERAATSLQDVLRTTPGITLGAGEGGVPNGDLPNIRGFAAESNITIDGMRDPGSQTRDMFNLEQVEVIKGPGSAFSGRGSTGGSINLVTKKPKDETFLTGNASVGYPLAGRVDADGNYAYDENFALRLNVMGSYTDVAGRDEVTAKHFGIAPSLALGLGEDTRVTLSYSRFQTDDMPDYGHPYDPATGKPVDVDQDTFYGLTTRDYQETQSDAATLEVTHDFNDRLTLRNITRYGWSENDYIVTNPDDSRGNVANDMVWRNIKSRNSDTSVLANQMDLSGDFETLGLKHAFNVGFEIAHENSRNRGYTVDTGNSDCSATGTGSASGYNCTSLFNPNPDDPWAGRIAISNGSSETTTDTRSVYAFDTVELHPQFLVNLGIRFDSYSTESESTGGRSGPFSGSNDSNFVNYQVGLVYKPLPNGSVYASFGTSSDPSGTTGGDGRDNLSATNVDLDPEDSRSFEIGTKWDFLERRLGVSGALFRTDKTNARVNDTSGTTLVLEGEQRVQGVELGVSGKITDDWRVFGGYTFMHSEIVDDGPGTNDGNQIPNVPRHSLSLWSSYDVLTDLTLGGGVTYMSSRQADTANTREVSDYVRLDLMAEYDVTENVGLRLNVNNLLDETYYDKPYSTHFATVAPGRSVLLTTSFKF